jgi:hypothetical protein
MVAHQLAVELQLMSALKLMSGKHFLVKGHLKPSFIDCSSDLNHIRVRPGSGRRVQGSDFQVGLDGKTSEAFSIPGQGEQR